MIAETITSAHNQHATLMIYAPTGAGKSWAGMAIGEQVSRYVAEIKGGTPRDYFSPESIAIITQEEVIRLLETGFNKKYSVVGFDDIGVGWNSRDFMSKFNQSMNDIYQIFRTRNCFLYVTLPDPMLIDKVPRDMVKYILEIYSSKFEFGYVEGKLFKLEKSPRQGKKRHPYILDFSDNRVVRQIIYTPSVEFVKDYEPRRMEIEKLMTGRSIDNLKEIVQESLAENLPKERPTKEQILAPSVLSWAEYGLVQSDIAKKVGCAVGTVNKILKQAK